MTREDEWARAVMIGFLLVVPLLFIGVAKLVERFNPAADEFIARHGPPPVDPRQRSAYQNLMGGLKSAADDLVEKRKDD